jgi:hypothetical protein
VQLDWTICERQNTSLLFSEQDIGHNNALLPVEEKEVKYF